MYQRLWKGRKLGRDEFVLSADEKTSVQARSRKAESLPPQPDQLMKIEIYFWILQRKVLTPNDFSSLQELAGRLLAFGRNYETIAQSFERRFTRRDLNRVLHKLGRSAAKAA